MNVNDGLNVNVYVYTYIYVYARFSLTHILDV